MSVHYDFKEKLHIKNIQSDEDLHEIVCIMQYQLAMITAGVALGVTRIGRIVIVTDGKRVEVERTNLTPELLAAIQSMCNANEVYVFLDYDYMWHLGLSSLNIGPFAMFEKLDKADDSLFDNVSYGVFQYADCNRGDGGLVSVYCKEDGKVHSGLYNQAASVAVDQVPVGSWEALEEPFYLDLTGDVSDEKVVKINELLSELARFSDDPMLASKIKADLHHRWKHFYFNQILLNGEEDIVQYCKLMVELWSIIEPELDNGIDSGFFTTQTFIGTDEDAIRTLEIELTVDSYKLSVRETF